MLACQSVGLLSWLPLAELASTSRFSSWSQLEREEAWILKGRSDSEFQNVFSGETDLLIWLGWRRYDYNTVFSYSILGKI